MTSKYVPPNSQSGTLMELLRHPTKKRDETGDPVARMMRELLYRHQILPDEWEVRADRYFRKIHGNDVQKISQEKINLSRSIAQNRISWNRFHQVLEILNYDEYTFTIGMKNRDMPEPRECCIKFRNRMKRQGDNDE